MFSSFSKAIQEKRNRQKAQQLPQQQNEQGCNFNKTQNKQGIFKFLVKQYCCRKWVIVAVIILLFLNQVYINYYPMVQEYLSIKNQNGEYFLIQAVNNLDQNVPKKYIGIQKLKDYPQLPVCVIVGTQSIQTPTQDIKKSIRNQQYSNYKILQFTPRIRKYANQDQKNLQSITAKGSYYDLLGQINSQCPQKSILFFVNEPLSKNALRIQNYYYQQYNTWLLYSLIEQNELKNQQQNTEIQIQRRKVNKYTKSVEVYSVYKRVFQMLDNNDFDNMNREEYKKYFDSSILMAGLFELSNFFSYEVRPKQLFQLPSFQNSFMSSNLHSNSQADLQMLFKRKSYQQMHTLDQNYKRQNIKQLRQTRKEFYASDRTLTVKFASIYPLSSKTTHQEFESAMQFQQIVHMSQNHSLPLLQLNLMQQKYKTDKYPQELPFCININSHNNMPNQRYKKVFDTVKILNYTNYHVVFIDDFSSDQTLNKTKQYLNEINFPEDKVTFVRNQKQKFATFNIVNAGFNYCPPNSIQMLLDGDDQLIGKQVLKMFNALYQEHDLWILYTFWKDDQYMQGVGQKFEPQFLQGFFGGPGRKLVYYFGHLMSFNTTLLKKLPLQCHLGWSGQFLDTLYDTALQYPMFQLAGQQKARFQPFINYLYFKGYGANDDSSIYKARRRDIVQIYISLKKSLDRIEKLDDSQQKQVRDVLDKLKGVDYVEIK